MIYTVTFNPSIDYIIHVNDFKPGYVNRAESDNMYPGGKGINVSRVLNNLNVKSKAMGFIGGFTGEYVKKYLEDEGLETDFIYVKGDTRINVKLKSTEETEINGSGPDIEEKDIEKLFEKIEKLTSEDFLVIAGRAQKSLPEDIYAQILKKCSKNGVNVIVDTTGKTLLCTLKYRPFLIKPNNHELGEIFNVEMVSIEKTIEYGKELLKMGAQNVIVSMAAEGALLISSEGVFHASAPRGVVRNSVGAGDSLIGGFLAKYSANFDLIEAFKWGAASGSATAFSFDLCKKEDVEALLDQVKITKLM
ncbi:1-phosphofructokinase [Fonticella tunisiensis]|uniref:Tagatose-6-phosphate kinase n=1 Tax=Fonticella tunisiensis TaxID=1096341 RepID=A0A4V3ETS2_9CLOT|nr:1-phosphofructokinase [Fonticella tunisiensis]TDT63685.1 1-phosphofructokinase [Fonticella tunisiensis]